MGCDILSLNTIKILLHRPNLFFYDSANVIMLIFDGTDPPISAFDPPEMEDQ
jgi:hypothetical protein